MRQVGIDFGTTNSVIALLNAAGSTRTAVFGTDAVFRLVLCFWAKESRAGPAAIAAWLDDPLDSRLIMSMKTWRSAASPTPASSAAAGPSSSWWRRFCGR